MNGYVDRGRACCKAEISEGEIGFSTEGCVRDDLSAETDLYASV